MRRRELLKAAAGLAGVVSAGLVVPEVVAATGAVPKIDAHIHLFDTGRPGGVPWPLVTDGVLYKPATPERYAQVSAGHDVVGAIAIEASPLVSDNDWLLRVVEAHPLMVGMVGDLAPGSAEFMKELERLRGNTLFLGIRYGNLWERAGRQDDLLAGLERPGFVEGLKALAEAGLVLECANPDPKLIKGMLRAAERVPGLRIVADHLPHAAVPDATRAGYLDDLRALAGHPGVFMKLSEIPVRVNGVLKTDVGFYRDRLDELWGIFGEQRILFGSDWPNSDTTASYEATLGIVARYMATKSRAAQMQYYGRNSQAAYKWKARRVEQKLV